jgi:hypothetical protein
MIWRATVPVLFVLALAACSSTPKSGGEVTVSGRVVSIEDQVPADGGVTVHLAGDRGEDVVLLYRSLFTQPPPPPEHVALYEVLRQVVPGDSVQAVGSREEGGIQITGFTVLGRAPRAPDYEITLEDNGKRFSYPVTSRFSVMLDTATHPAEELAQEPEGLLGRIGSEPAVPPQLYVVRFEAVRPGTTVLSNRDFRVTIDVVE